MIMIQKISPPYERDGGRNNNITLTADVESRRPRLRAKKKPKKKKTKKTTTTLEK